MTKEGIEQLKLDEGLRLAAYTDTVGVWTIGYGHTRGVHEGDTCTEEEAENFLLHDIAEAENDAMSIFPGFHDFSPARRDAIINLSFNLGYNRLLGFHGFLRAMRAGQWEAASAELQFTNPAFSKETPWHQQVGSRAHRIEQAIREG